MLQDIFQEATADAAVIVPGKEVSEITYSSLQSAVKELGVTLREAGIGSGAVVSNVLPNSFEFITLFFAVASLSAVNAPLNPGYREDEVKFYLDDTKASLIVVPKGAVGKDSAATKAARATNVAVAECSFDGSKVHLEIIDKVEKKDQQDDSTDGEDQTVLILHTSGTTGKPKAVPLTHKNLLTSAKNIQETYKLTSGDCGILIMPLYHIHGIVAGMLGPLFSKGTLIVSSSITPTFWPLVRDHKATWFTGTPTMHNLLLQQQPPSPAHKFRFVRSCSSPLSPAIFKRLEEFYDCPVLEAYAMTEAAHQMTSNPLPPGKRTPGNVGFPTNVELEILDAQGEAVPKGERGEICIRAANVTKGYLHNEEANKTAFTSSGFFRTGDEGRINEDGAVELTGRLKELINKGGEKISPIEIDNVMGRHEAISEAVSFAIPDEVLGEEVGAAVSLHEGKELSELELKKWIRKEIALFKAPKKIWFVDSIPKTGTGKLQRLSVAKAMLEQDK